MHGAEPGPKDVLHDDAEVPLLELLRELRRERRLRPIEVEGGAVEEARQVLLQGGVPRGHCYSYP